MLQLSLAAMVQVTGLPQTTLHRHMKAAKEEVANEKAEAGTEIDTKVRALQQSSVFVGHGVVCRALYEGCNCPPFAHVLVCFYRFACGVLLLRIRSC